MTVGRRVLPPLARAFLSYLWRVQDPYLIPVLLLREEVESEVESAIDRLFAEVESDLEDAVTTGDLELAPGATAVSFDYDTRLVLPAMLTHGRVRELAGDVPLVRRSRAVDTDLVERGRETTQYVVRALLDGDMRDAINDEEYGDFETSVRPRTRAAAIAQSTLEAGVLAWFDEPDTPQAVKEHYRHAVELSEGHQTRDREYRELLAQYHASEGAERRETGESLRIRYRDADTAGVSRLFDAERHLPYFATQYERVGVLYEEMLSMYEADLEVDLGDAFKRSIVLMVIAAQMGLDDVDDYPEDRGTQLTPVTAELALHGPTDGIENVRGLVTTYLDRAADASENHLTGMAIEYIRQDALDRLDALAADLQ